MRRLAKIIGGLIACVVVLLGGYVVAAVILTRVPVNADFEPVAGGIPIRLVDNGVHVDLHLPIVTERVDWRQVFPLSDFPRPPANPATIAFGWGDRDFYLNTPTWDEFELETGVRAALGLGGTVLRVGYWHHFVDGDTVATTTISAEAYGRLVDYILATIRPDLGGRPIRISGAAYRGNDGFYEAYGAYNVFVTCNEWVRRGLESAGIRTSWWSPLPGAMLDHWR